MKIKVDSEQWFKKAPFHSIRMLGIKHLNIPAEKFETKQPEPFKRALVRQVFVQHHQYGEEFEILEPSNPFGTARKKKVSASETLVGPYVFKKNGLRAAENDIRHEMMKAIMNHTTFEEVLAYWKETNGSMRYKSERGTGKLEFDFQGQLNWALKRGWIERI